MRNARGGSKSLPRAEDTAVHQLYSGTRAAAGAVGAAGKKITKPEKTDLHLASQYRR
jgi:hypothetical protein